MSAGTFTALPLVTGCRVVPSNTTQVSSTMKSPSGIVGVPFDGLVGHDGPVSTVVGDPVMIALHRDDL